MKNKICNFSEKDLKYLTSPLTLEKVDFSAI